MEEVVLDSSVVVKWFLNETDSTKAKELVDKLLAGKIKIFVPEIILLELINSLSLGAKLSKEEIKTAISYFYNLNLIIVTLKRSLIEKTLEIATEFKIASYDAFFMAVADEKRIPLITADRKHHLREYSPLVKYLG